MADFKGPGHIGLDLSQPDECKRHHPVGNDDGKTSLNETSKYRADAYIPGYSGKVGGRVSM